MPPKGPLAFTMEELDAVVQNIDGLIECNFGFEERGVRYIPLNRKYGELSQIQQEQIARVYERYGWKKACVEHGTLHDDQYWLRLHETL